MVSRLIFYKCEHCGILHKIFISKVNLTVSVLDKLYPEKDVFDSNGYLTCIDCDNKNKFQIQRVFP